MPGFWIYLDLCGLSGHSSLLHNMPADGQGLNIYILYTNNIYILYNVRAFLLSARKILFNSIADDMGWGGIFLEWWW